MKIFLPDLVVEVTSACNRSCSGCYAPNVVSNETAAELIKKDSSLFISSIALYEAILFWDQELPNLVSIRGGEPSLHPELPGIIINLKNLSINLVIETHGRWLLKKNRDKYKDLVNMVIAENVTVKLSFDSMHGLGPKDLKEITDFLESVGASFMIAITEDSLVEFSSTRNLAYWIMDEKFYFQQKATSQDELLKPRLGVINSRGALRKNLSSKFPSSNEYIDLLAISEVAAG